MMPHVVISTMVAAATKRLILCLYMITSRLTADCELSVYLSYPLLDMGP